MKPTKYPVVKIIQILAEANLPGSSVAEICRKYSIGRSTFDSIITRQLESKQARKRGSQKLGRWKAIMLP